MTKRLLLVLVLLLGLPALAAANACVSTGTGAWATAGTWTSCGGTQPGSSDTATIGAGHIVTSAAPASVGAIVINGTLALQANFVFFGAVTGSGTLYCHTDGVTVQIISTLGVAVVDLYGTAAAAANRVTLDGGGIGRISSATTMSLLFTHVTLSNMGGGGVNYNSITLTDFGVGPITWVDVYQTTNGRIDMNSTAANAVLNIAGWDVRNIPSWLSGGWIIYSSLSTSPAGGTRSITGFTVYHTYPAMVTQFVTDGMTLEGVWHNTYLFISGYSSNTKVIYAWGGAGAPTTDTFQIMGASAGVVEESALLTDYAGAVPHLISESGNGGASNNIYQDLFVDGFGTTDPSANVLLPTMPVTAQRIIGVNAGALVETSTTAVNPTIKHITWYNSYNLLQTESVTAPATLWKFLTNTLMVNTSHGIVQLANAMSRQTTFVMDYNGYYGQTVGTNLRDASGNLTYVAQPSIVLTTGTATASTTTTVVVASAADFTTAGVLAGDWVVSLQGQGHAQILSVDSATQLTLKTAITGFAAGNTFSVRQHYVAGSLAYGAANFGANDVYGDPQFVDPTVTALTFIPGAVTFTDAMREYVKLNGRVYDGSLTTPTAKTRAGLLAYIRAGFRPRNAAFHTASDVDVGGWMGAVAGTSGRSIRLSGVLRIAPNAP